MLEKQRIERLQLMLNWRLERKMNGHQQAEAEALAWAIEQLKNCLAAEAGVSNDD